MIWTGWNNGKKHPTGAGYGFKVPIVDRDRIFKPEWRRIVVELPTPSWGIVTEVNVAKPSFEGHCREVISEGIGRWMLDRGFAPWPKGRPPKFDVELLGAGSFRVKSPAAVSA
jgi:hypothetical protein